LAGTAGVELTPVESSRWSGAEQEEIKGCSAALKAWGHRLVLSSDRESAKPQRWRWTAACRRTVLGMA